MPLTPYQPPALTQRFIGTLPAPGSIKFTYPGLVAATRYTADLEHLAVPAISRQEYPNDDILPAGTVQDIVQQVAPTLIAVLVPFLDQRFATLEQRLNARFNEQAGTLNAQFNKQAGAFNARFNEQAGAFNTRFDEQAARTATLNTRFDQQETKLERVEQKLTALGESLND
ncbi:hypothetical protein FRC10_010029 [Ceratobasidium sp. 414]|nr:hypothetical protein FRC10_010029 [Ceratobasidium sp. 414]